LPSGKQTKKKTTFKSVYYIVKPTKKKQREMKESFTTIFVLNLFVHIFIFAYSLK